MNNRRYHILEVINQRGYARFADLCSEFEVSAAPLRKIRDSYEKIVIALECDLTQTQDGIKIIRALDFLLED